MLKLGGTKHHMMTNFQGKDHDHLYQYLYCEMSNVILITNYRIELPENKAHNLNDLIGCCEIVNVKYRIELYEKTFCVSPPGSRHPTSPHKRIT